MSSFLPIFRNLSVWLFVISVFALLNKESSVWGRSLPNIASLRCQVNGYEMCRIRKVIRPPISNAGPMLELSGPPQRGSLLCRKKKKGFIFITTVTFFFSLSIDSEEICSSLLVFGTFRETPAYEKQAITEKKTYRGQSFPAEVFLAPSDRFVIHGVTL